MCEFSMRLNVGRRAYVGSVYGCSSGIAWFPQYLRRLRRRGLISVDGLVRVAPLRIRLKRGSREIQGIDLVGSRCLLIATNSTSNQNLGVEESCRGG